MSREEELAQIIADAQWEQEQLERERQRGMVARILAGERYFEFENELNTALVYVEVTEIKERHNNGFPPYEMFGLQFSLRVIGHPHLPQTEALRGYLRNYNLRDCEKAFLSGKSLSESQFRAAWDNAVADLTPKKGEHDAVK